MNRKRGKSLSGQMFKQDNRPRLSLHDFLVQSRAYLTTIISCRQDMEQVTTLFSEEQEIWPDQCEYTTMMLATAQELIKAFCRLLDTATLLPICVVPLRYPLMVTLHYIDEQISTISALVGTFSSICHASSQRAVRQRQEIHRKLVGLMQRSRELSQLTHQLIDQAQFEERRLAQVIFYDERPALDDSTVEIVQTDDIVRTDDIIYLISAQRQGDPSREAKHYSQPD